MQAPPAAPLTIRACVLAPERVRRVEGAQSGVGHKGGQPAAHQRHGQYAAHHHKAVFDVERAAFGVGTGTGCAGQHIACQGDADGVIGGDAQKGDQHGTDYRSGANPRKAGAQSSTRTRQKTDQNLKPELSQPYYLPNARPELLRRCAESGYALEIL